MRRPQCLCLIAQAREDILPESIQVIRPDVARQRRGDVLGLDRALSAMSSEVALDLGSSTGEYLAANNVVDDALGVGLDGCDDAVHEGVELGNPILSVLQIGTEPEQ